MTMEAHRAAYPYELDDPIYYTTLAYLSESGEWLTVGDAFYNLATAYEYAKARKYKKFKCQVTVEQGYELRDKS